MDRSSRHIYLLQSGRIYLTNSRGAIVDYLVPCNFFGEKCLLGPRYQNQIATSRSPVQVHTFRKSELLDRIQTDRRFALRLLKNLALRLDRYEQALGDIVTERIEGRLARLPSRLAPAKTLNRSKVDLFLFAVSYSCRLKSDPGSARLAKTYRLSNGVGPGLLQGRRATNPCIAAAEVMLLREHSGTNP